MGSSFHLVRAAARRRRVIGLASAAGLLAGIVTGLAGGPAALASTQAYTVTDLGDLGFPESSGLGINAAGEVVGYSYLAKTVKVRPCPSGGDVCEVRPADPFSWIGGKITDVGTLSTGDTTNFSEALAVNRTGDIAGDSNGSAFLFHNGKISQVGPAGFRATGINDAGNIVGYINSHAYLISGGTMTQLPDLAGPATTCCNGPHSSPVGINDNNQIVGSSDNNTGTHAVTWTNGALTDLGTLGGPQSFASAINNLGQVVGFAQTSTDANHGFVWSNGTMTDLGPNFFPAAINDNGVIVGGDQIDSSGTLLNLNNLIPAGSPYQIHNATAINNNGQIAANAENTATHQSVALLLTPS